MGESIFLGKYCDRCIASAKVEVLLKSGGVLLFCGHHARVNNDALVMAGATFTTEGPAESERETGTKIPVTNIP